MIGTLPVLEGAGPEWAEQVTRVRESPALASLMRDLQPCLQPIDRITQASEPVLGSLELLLTHRTGERYGALLGRAQDSGLRSNVFDLLALGMQAEFVHRLRADFAALAPQRSARLRFALNVTCPMLQSGLVARILAEFLTASDMARIDLELSEGQELADTVRVREVLERMQLPVVLDDVNRMDESVVAGLADLAKKTKVDAKFVQKLLADRTVTNARPQRVIERIEKYRSDGGDLVLEGIETEHQLRFVLDSYPDEFGGTWVQGFAVKLRASVYASILRPLLNGDGQTVGYTYRDSIWG